MHDTKRQKSKVKGAIGVRKMPFGWICENENLV